MGQNISLIILKDTGLEIPAEVPHFIHDGLLEIPIGDDYFGLLLEEIIKTGNYNFWIIPCMTSLNL